MRTKASSAALAFAVALDLCRSLARRLELLRQGAYSGFNFQHVAVPSNAEPSSSALVHGAQRDSHDPALSAQIRMVNVSLS